MLAFITIATALGVGATFHSAWIILLGGVIMMLISARENRVLYRRCYYGDADSQGFAIATIMASFVNGLIACSVAYLFGALIATFGQS